MTMLALLMAASLSTPSVGAPGHAAVSREASMRPSARPPVAVRIEHQALLEEQIAAAAEDTAFYVRTDTTKALRDVHGMHVVEGVSAPTVVVRLQWLRYEESIYRVRVETERPGQSPQLVESFECACADSELAAAVVSRLPAALAQLERDERPLPMADDAPAAEPPGIGSVTDPVSGPLRGTANGVVTGPVSPPVIAPGSEGRRPPPPLGALGFAALGVAAVGAGALVSGGIVFAQGRRLEPANGLELREGRNFEPPGVALMVSGAAALAAGAVLLIVDRTQARRPPVARVLPTPGGLAVMGHF